MVNIRDVKPDDADRLVEIYDYYCKNTAITFEYDTPSVEEFRARIIHITERYPYLVIEEDGVIYGYAYAGAFHERAAYSWACELSIYLDKTIKHRGFGRMLYDALEERLKHMGVLNLYACIAYPVNPDSHLDKNSEGFHEHLGFSLIGEFHKCGYKFDTWYDMIWMEKLIGEHGHGVAPIKNYLKR